MTQATDALTYLLFSAELQSRTQPANREQALRKIALIQTLSGQPSSLSALDRELKLGPIVEGEDEDELTSRARRDRLPGGVGDSLPDEEFDPDQLAIGIRHEMEHTDDEDLAKEIAKDHLTEDPDYYTKLAQIELAQIEESWDESKHPRDHGKFAKKEGGTTLADKMPGNKSAAQPQPSKTILQRAIQIAVSSSPTAIAAKHIARQAGFSERTATILSVVASVGDWSIPGVPAGSSAVIVGALLKRPTVAIAVSQEMMRKARSLVREVALSVVGSFRESEEEKIVDEEALLAIGEWLESVDDQEWATAVLAAAMEEADGNLEKALTIAEQVMKFGSQLAEAEEDEDPMERAEAIAELLLSVYGEDALEMFDEDKSESRVLESLLEAWNPDAHPRGANGRFIKKNSPEAVAATKGAIKDSLRKPRSGDTFQELMEHLNILTTKQIRELSKEYGVSVGGRVKAELVEKIAKRLDVGRRGENEDLSKEEFPTYDEWAKGEREKRKKEGRQSDQPAPVAPEAAEKHVHGRGLFDNYKKQGALSATQKDIEDERKKFKGFRLDWRKAVWETNAKMNGELKSQIENATEKQELINDQMKEEYGKRGYSGNYDDLAKKHKKAARDVNDLIEKYKSYDAFRRVAAEKALASGKPLPPEVLADYPDLAEKYGQDGPKEGDRNAGRENSSQKDLTTSTTGDTINTGDEKQPVSSGGSEMNQQDVSDPKITFTNLLQKMRDLQSTNEAREIPFSEVGRTLGAVYTVKSKPTEAKFGPHQGKQIVKVLYRPILQGLVGRDLGTERISHSGGEPKEDWIPVERLAEWDSAIRGIFGVEASSVDPYDKAYLTRKEVIKKLQSLREVN